MGVQFPYQRSFVIIGAFIHYDYDGHQVRACSHLDTRNRRQRPRPNATSKSNLVMAGGECQLANLRASFFGCRVPIRDSKATQQGPGLGTRTA